MSAEKRILELIRAGETSGVEFKSSFRFDLKAKNVNKDLTKAVVKTVAGFMNSQGGTLLIGVSDSGEIVGIENDIETLTKKSVDGFELALRTAVANFIGGEKSAAVVLTVYKIDGKLLAQVACAPYPEPVVFRDGEKYEFYIRDGNLTRSLNAQEQYNYTKRRLTESDMVPAAIIKKVVSEVLNQQRQNYKDVAKEEEAPPWRDRIINFFRRSATGIPMSQPGPEIDIVQQSLAAEISERTELFLPKSSRLPPWLTVQTRNVIDAYLYALDRSPDWKRLYIISPWLSALDESFSLTSIMLAERLKDYGTTVYVVTRPPVEQWHQDAIDALAATGRANIAVLPDLHAKLYTASTAAGSFALVGSANFTQQSGINWEIGLLAYSYMEGKQVVSALDREAADVYRTPGRKLIHHARF